MSDPVVRVNRTSVLADIAISKLSTFDFSEKDVDRVVDDMLKTSTSLILDLRGNGGGQVKTLAAACRAPVRSRRETRRSGRPQGNEADDGEGPKEPVHREASSWSSTPTPRRLPRFSRASIQIERRGIVIGDRSSGSVMQAEQGMGMLEGTEGLIPYGFSVTDADVIMTDGKSLEHVGVVPDEVVLWTPADLAAGRDPVLARAVAILGRTLDPVAAGKLFPVEWK